MARIEDACCGVASTTGSGHLVPVVFPEDVDTEGGQGIRAPAGRVTVAKARVWIVQRADAARRLPIVRIGETPTMDDEPSFPQTRDLQQRSRYVEHSDS